MYLVNFGSEIWRIKHYKLHRAHIYSLEVEVKFLHHKDHLYRKHCLCTPLVFLHGAQMLEIKRNIRQRISFGEFFFWNAVCCKFCWTCTGQTSWMLKQALVEGINPLGEFLFFKLQVFAPYINRTNRFDRKCLMDPPFVYLYMRQMSESKQSFKGFSLVNSCFDMYIYLGCWQGNSLKEFRC